MSLGWLNTLLTPVAIKAGSVVAGLVLVKRYFIGGQCTHTSDLNGKYIIITGANTGIGKESAIILAKMGGHIIMACRDENRGLAAVADVKTASGSQNVDYMNLDLSDLSSVRKFSKEYHNRFSRLDILLNNAGVMMCPKSKTKDGFEMQFGTNHLGHFLLTMSLLDTLKRTPKSRVVNVSSMAHYQGKIDFDDIMFERRKYSSMTSYQQTKLANVLFTNEFQRRYGDSGITSYSVHPGFIRSDLARHVFDKWYKNLILGAVYPLYYLFSKDVTQGAQTNIYCSIAPDIPAGYYSDCRLKKPCADALDEKIAKQLWDVSTKLVGLTK